MVVYITAFALSLFMCLGADVTSEKSSIQFKVSRRVIMTTPVRALNRALTILAPLPVLFITWFRYGVGADYLRTYTNDYYRYKSGQEVHSNWGLNAFYWISQYISKDPIWFFILTGTVIVISIFAASYILSHTLSLSVFLFFVDDTYFRSISMVAQFMATALLLLSFSLIYKKDTNKYYIALGCLLSVYACLTHSSAVLPCVALLVLLLLKRFFGHWVLFVAMLIPLVTLIFQSFISSLILRFMASTRFGSYIGSAFSGVTSTSMFALELIFLCFMLFIAFTNYNYPEKQETQNVIYAAILIESLAVSITLLQTVPLMYRISYYFAAFHIITFPVVLQSVRNRFLRVLLLLIISAILIVWFWQYPVAGNYDDPLPYVFIFNAIK